MVWGAERAEGREERRRRKMIVEVVVRRDESGCMFGS